MALEIPKEARTEAIASIQRSFEACRASASDIAAGGLLGFILDEMGPVIYNEAVDDLPVTPLARHHALVTRASGLIYRLERFEFFQRIETCVESWAWSAKRQSTS
jgi:uncharacterized protein (DUF2164 family)